MGALAASRRVAADARSAVGTGTPGAGGAPVFSPCFRRGAPHCRTAAGLSPPARPIDRTPAPLVPNGRGPTRSGLEEVAPEFRRHFDAGPDPIQLIGGAEPLLGDHAGEEGERRRLEVAVPDGDAGGRVRPDLVAGPVVLHGLWEPGRQ